MTSFIELSALARSLLCTWSVLLIICYIFNCIKAFHQKQKIFIALSFSGFLLSYFIFQISAEISAYKSSENMQAIAKNIANLPYIYFILIYLSLTLFCAFCFKKISVYTKNQITLNSVKEATDSLPVGLCYYYDNGRVFMINNKFNEISVALCNHPVMNGLEFLAMLSNKNMLKLPDGSVYRFYRKRHISQEETFNEIIADDVTELYRKNEDLRFDNKRLKLHSENMKQYGKTIDKTVRQEEILKAKAKIHSEMNNLLLETDYAIKSGTSEQRQTVLNKWQENILILCMQADSEDDNDSFADLDKLADCIGIKLVYSSKPTTKNIAALRLFLQTVEEAAVNAVKHAKAKNLFIAVSEDESSLTAAFTNDGEKPTQNISETGGLSLLRYRIENAGGRMNTQSLPEYVLTVILKKGDIENVL